MLVSLRHGLMRVRWRVAPPNEQKNHCQPKKNFNRNFEIHPTRKKNFSAPMFVDVLVAEAAVWRGGELDYVLEVIKVVVTSD